MTIYISLNLLLAILAAALVVALVYVMGSVKDTKIGGNVSMAIAVLLIWWAVFDLLRRVLG